jgi:folate/biopterin transporter
MKSISMMIPIPMLLLLLLLTVLGIPRIHGFTTTTPRMPHSSRHLLLLQVGTTHKQGISYSRRYNIEKTKTWLSSSSEDLSTCSSPLLAQNETELELETTTIDPIITADMVDYIEQEVVQVSLVRTWLKDNIFLGIDPSPDIIAIATIYFVEGALGLARLAQTFLLKDELHLGPAELSALTGIFTLPWTIKPLYGFLSDGIPLFGFRRRSYLMLAGLTGCLSYSLLGNNFFGFLNGDALIPGTIASLLISSACIAFSDVVADGIVVQKTRDSNDPQIAGGLQSLCWGSAAIGGLLSAYFSGSLLEVMKPQDIFSITAFLPFMVAAIAFLIDEEPAPKSTNADLVAGVQTQAADLWNAIKQPSIYKPALFLFLWQSTPTSDGAFLFFMTDELGFGPEFLGRVSLVTAGAGLFGVWVYNSYLKTKSIKDILFWSSIIATPLGLSTLLLITHANRALGIPDGAFVFGDDVALAILGQIAFMPTLVLAARLCPPGVEAVLFATLMSINNGAGALGTEIGAGLTKWLGVTATNFDNLGLLTGTYS